MALIISSLAFSQVVIGGDTGSAGNNTNSVLLDFPTGQNKGIILPYVRTLPTTPAEGTIVLDAVSGTAARVKYYNANTHPGTNGWVDLSGQNGTVTTALSTQPTTTEIANAKAIIGADENTPTPDGVLVLESTTKAMVLPIVSDVNNIPSPSPGMMVYVNKADAKRLAVFNGTKWSFWEP